MVKIHFVWNAYGANIHLLNSTIAVEVKFLVVHWIYLHSC